MINYASTKKSTLYRKVTGVEIKDQRAAGNKSISKQNTFIVHLCLGGYCKVEARALVRY